MKYALAVALALAAAVPAQAVLIDDFNRANGGLGSNYTVQNGSLSILDNQVVNTQFVSLATYNGSSSTSAGLDVSLRGMDSGSYAALALGYAGGGVDELSYFIKVQDENGDGWFDKYAFYGGNNNFDGAIGSLNPFQSGTIDVSYMGTLASLVGEVGILDPELQLRLRLRAHEHGRRHRPQSARPGG